MISKYGIIVVDGNCVGRIGIALSVIHLYSRADEKSFPQKSNSSAEGFILSWGASAVSEKPSPGGASVLGRKDGLLKHAARKKNEQE